MFHFLSLLSCGILLAHVAKAAAMTARNALPELQHRMLRKIQEKGVLWCLRAGLRIEELMRQMCSRRIDYYFAPIDGSTVKMCRIMQQAYVHSHNAEFQVNTPCTQSSNGSLYLLPFENLGLSK